MEWNVLLDNLQSCPVCRMGPIPLTKDSLVGELQKGLSGYIYVRCGNNDCQAVVQAAYGKTHHMKKKGMPCFVVNTKLGTGNYSSQTTLIIFRGLVKSQSLPNLYQYDGFSSTSEQDEEVRLQCNQLFYDKPGTF